MSKYKIGEMVEVSFTGVVEKIKQSDNGNIFYTIYDKSTRMDAFVMSKGLIDKSNEDNEEG